MIRFNVKRFLVLLGILIVIGITLDLILSRDLARNPIFDYGNFRYRVIADSSAVELTRYTRQVGGALRIPSHIDGLPVTRITSDAFAYRSGMNRQGLGIVAVSIPDTVTYIGRNAFAQNLLNTVNIPASVTTISRYAFGSNQIGFIDIPDTIVHLSGFNNNNLTSVYIPYGVRYIGGYAFRMNQITSVSIPDSVVDIGLQAFRHNRLAEVSVPAHARIVGNAFDSDVTIIRRD